ncbi:hypothetical protein [Salinilacihabitans rarus]|uniref:hypothetical protein n=1 Tax=Salinilacihabitans rarus TaxID=2961596 RepID=UPI0020C83B0B|nr:hypothetical protein [Salinilacihabitans rarus]
MADAMIDRSMNDESFLAKVRSDPEAVVEEYDLDGDAADAVAARDEEAAVDVFSIETSTVVIIVVV